MVAGWRNSLVLLGLVLAVVPHAAQAQAQPSARAARTASVGAPLSIASPGGALVVTVGLGDQLTWSVALRGKVILAPSRIGLSLAGAQALGAKPVVSATSTRAPDQVLFAILPSLTLYKISPGHQKVVKFMSTVKQYSDANSNL